MTAGGLFCVDAFCGAGGLSLGLKGAGIRPAAAFDLNPSAIATYRRNLGQHAAVADARDVTAGTLASLAGFPLDGIAVVAGGPPCQGFSVQRRNGDGDDDTRNSLPFAYFRIIRELRPTFFIFENVPGMKARHGEEVLRQFVEDAESSGYACHVQTLDAVNYGVPQSRRRLFVIGEATADGRTWFRFPKPVTSEGSPEVTVGHALAGLPSPPDDFSPHPSIPNHRRIKMSDLNRLRISRVPQGGGMQDLPPELRVKCHRKGADRIGHRYVYGRLHWERAAATITARFDSFTRGRFGHPLEDRNITLREGARLQTFPDDFVFEGSQEEVAAQIGNAVPPKLAEALGAAIVEALEKRRQGAAPVGRRNSGRQHLLFS